MRLPRRDFLRLAGLAGAAAATSACDRRDALRFRRLMSGGKPEIAAFTAPGGATPDYLTRALRRLTWGVAPGEHAAVSALAPDHPQAALQRWLETQLEPERIDDIEADAATARVYETLQARTGDLYDHATRELDDALTRQAILRAVHSRRQVLEVMVAFWSDHFNIDSSKADCRWLKAADDRDVIRAHALGKFPDLLRASALSPAMLWYLDGRANTRRHPEDKPNENYARELLELHTLGVNGGYTQQDVMEAARCLTGWTVTGREDGATRIARVHFREEAHDDGAKRVLGQDIPAGGGAEDLTHLITIVSQHPSTVQRMAGKLVRWFIPGDPPPALVQSVGAAWSRSGGDVREYLRALVADPAFAAAEAGTSVKRPFHFLASALRTTGTLTGAGPDIQRFLRVTGHQPFHYPSPEGPEPAGEAWLSTLLHRWDFALRLTNGTLAGTRCDPSALTAAAGGPDGLVRHLTGCDPTADDAALFTSSPQPLALLLAAPAFQLY